MKKYQDFIKLLENENIVISLMDIENVIKIVFDDTKVSSVSTIYEKDENVNKLVLTINNLFHEKTNIIHTKFIFYIDDKKTKLNKPFFHYFYDINCKYKKVSFDGVLDLEMKLNEIINERKFGKDIKILSNLLVTLSSKVNDILAENGITNISIYNVKYTPIVDSVPCDSMSFRFDINIDDIREIKMIIRKVDEDEYKITFNENDWFEDMTTGSLKSIPQLIIEMIKNYLV